MRTGKSMAVSCLAGAFFASLAASAGAAAAVPQPRTSYATHSAGAPPVQNWTSARQQQISSASALTPETDPFYSAPADLASLAPGTVVRMRPVSLQEPSVVANTAYQLAFRSSDHANRPLLGVTTLVLPRVPAPGHRPLLSYQLAEDSVTADCAPSYALQSTNGGEGTIHQEMSYAEIALQRGWDLLIPDHEGPEAEWFVGPDAGRIVLDSIRAAERFTPAGLAGRSTPVGLMGYSGGALPSAWAASLQGAYAPELTLKGQAIGGIGADLYASLTGIDGSPFFGVVVPISLSIENAFPQYRFHDLLNDAGRQLAATDTDPSAACGVGGTNAPLKHFSDYTIEPSAQAFAALPQVRSIRSPLRLADHAAPRTPSFFYQGQADELTVTPPVTALVASYCARGVVMDYTQAPGEEHAGGSVSYAAPALQYLVDRFAGITAPNTCPAKTSPTTTPTETPPTPPGSSGTGAHPPSRSGTRRTLASTGAPYGIAALGLAALAAGLLASRRRRTRPTR